MVECAFFSRQPLRHCFFPVRPVRVFIYESSPIHVRLNNRAAASINRRINFSELKPHQRRVSIHRDTRFTYRPSRVGREWSATTRGCLRRRRRCPSPPPQVWAQTPVEHARKCDTNPPFTTTLIYRQPLGQSTEVCL